MAFSNYIFIAHVCHNPVINRRKKKNTTITVHWKSPPNFKF